MTDESHAAKVPRRKFIAQAAIVAGAIAAGGSAAIYHGRRKRNLHQHSPDRASVHSTNIDPKWLAYDEVGRFAAPRSKARRLGIGSDDRLYVAAGKYISVIDSAGSVINEIALASDVRCVSAADELVYAGVRDHIEVFDAAGRRQATWDLVPNRPWLTGLAVGKNDLFAADAGNRVVLRYDRSGKLLSRIGERNVDRNIPGFVVPSPFFDVALASDELIRVTNPGRHEVQTFTIDGDLELSWGGISPALWHFCGCCNPISLRLLPDGRAVTCEKGIPRVKVYNSQGQLESVVAAPSSFPENAMAARNGDMGALDAVSDANGTIFILDSVRNDIRVMRRKESFA